MSFIGIFVKWYECKYQLQTSGSYVSWNELNYLCFSVIFKMNIMKAPVTKSCENSLNSVPDPLRTQINAIKQLSFIFVL